MTQTTKKRGNNPASRMKIKLDDVNWYPAGGARKTRRAGAGHASPSQPQGEGPVARERRPQPRIDFRLESGAVVPPEAHSGDATAAGAPRGEGAVEHKERQVRDGQRHACRQKTIWPAPHCQPCSATARAQPHSARPHSQAHVKGNLSVGRRRHAVATLVGTQTPPPRCNNSRQPPTAGAVAAQRRRHREPGHTAEKSGPTNGVRFFSARSPVVARQATSAPALDPANARRLIRSQGAQAHETPAGPQNVSRMRP